VKVAAGRVDRKRHEEATMAEYIPSPSAWVAEQVELYEGSVGTDGLTLRDTGLPVIIVTNRGRKTGGIRKTPLMRVVDGSSYILVASKGGAPQRSGTTISSRNPKLKFATRRKFLRCGFER
jgi:hypothetical protein